MMTKEKMRKLAYERFRLWWMMSHGYSLTDLMGCMDIMFHEAKQNGLQTDPSELFDRWKFDVGFAGGAIWPCFGEFMDCEYANREIMHCILSPDEYIQYLQIEEQEDLRPAIYISRWDGFAELRFKCMVNMATRNVYSVEVISEDICVDHLDGEFVEIDGSEYPVYEENEYDILEPEEQKNAYWRR